MFSTFLSKAISNEKNKFVQMMLKEAFLMQCRYNSNKIDNRKIRFFFVLFFWIDLQQSKKSSKLLFFFLFF